jgi:hypothetical protein
MPSAFFNIQINHLQSKIAYHKHFTARNLAATKQFVTGDDYYLSRDWVDKSSFFEMIYLYTYKF